MESNTVTETSPDLLYRELDNLRNANVSKKREISDLRKEIEVIVRDRDQLNSEVRTVADEIKSLRTKRDSLNAKVKELKLKRDELRIAAAKKREALSQLLEQAQHTSEKLQGNMSDLMKQITRLEWQIQTTTLAPKTERSIIGRIAELEVYLAKHKELKNVKDRLLKLRVEVGALRIQAQSSHEELTHLAEDSEKVHNEMQEKVRILSEKKKEADTKHTSFLEKSKQRMETIVSLRNNMARVDQIRTQIGDLKTSTRSDKAEKVKSKYKEAAEEKMRNGGKLSFEEFQALMADGIPEGEEE
jgi:uncharacterized coiled-coil DUF342 family protein